MNFRRIQWIFLWAFIVVDLVLASTFFWGTRFSPSQRQLTQTQLTLKEMRADGITVPKLSEHRQSGYYIVATPGDLAAGQRGLVDQETRIDDDQLTVTFAHPLEPRRSLGIAHQLDFLLGDPERVVHGKAYRYNRTLSTARERVYTQTIKGQPVLSPAGQLIFSVNQQGEVTGYRQGYLTNSKPLRPENSTISALQAVTWLYRHNEIPNGTRLGALTYGYSRLLTREGKEVYVPTWQVSLRAKGAPRGENLRVNAFSGTIIRDNN